MAGGEVVVDEEVMARFSQGLDDVASDVPGAAGDEYLHGSSVKRPWLSNPWRKAAQGKSLRARSSTTLVNLKKQEKSILFFFNSLTAPRRLSIMPPIYTRGLRRDVRAAEGARLEIVCTPPKVYRGFKSRSLRQI